MTRVHRYAAGFANLALAGVFLWCWLQPHAWKRTLAADLTVLMLLEIFALAVTNELIDRFHPPEAQDEEARRRNELREAAALPVFAIAVLSLIAYTGAWLSAGLLLWTIAPRYWLISGLKGAPDAAAKDQMAVWKLSFLVLILLFFIAKGLPIPRLGMKLPSTEYGIPATWFGADHPQDLVALGLGYFTLTGLMLLLSRPPEALPG